jgi:hypothetical protein
LRSRQYPQRKPGMFARRTETPRTRLTIYTIFLVIFIFITILTVLYHFTRDDQSIRDDPQFNPLNNPFIRVGERIMKNQFKESNVANNQAN